MSYSGQGHTRGFADRIAGLGLGRVLVAVAINLALTSCANLKTPDYERPQTPVKQSWSDDSRRPVSAADTIRPDWWKNFNDPILDRLIDTAIEQNIDIKILAARIGVAEASIGQAEAQGLPTVEGAVGGSIQKSQGLDAVRQYSASNEFRWEIDIWGKVEKGVQAQQAAYKASEADWRAGYLKLVADVSSNYFTIRTLDEQLDQLGRALEKNNRILSIYAGLHREGLLPKTQILQQRAEVNKLNNNRLELQRRRALSENALATLLGIPAGDFHIRSGHLRDTVHLMDVPAGLPARLLNRRPDIIAAEYRVLEATELVGQAQLAQLPSISLTGRAGNSSVALSNLLKSWTLGLFPTIDLPVFDPSVRARIKVNEAQTKVAEEEYRRTVMTGFEEVENSLTNLASRKQQKQELEARRANLQVAADQIYAQLREGLVSQLEVFEADRTLLSSELELLDNHRQILEDTVALYKALGGGWPQELVTQSP